MLLQRFSPFARRNISTNEYYSLCLNGLSWRRSGGSLLAVHGRRNISSYSSNNNNNHSASNSNSNNNSVNTFHNHHYPFPYSKLQSQLHHHVKQHHLATGTATSTHSISWFHHNTSPLLNNNNTNDQSPPSPSTAPTSTSEANDNTNANIATATTETKPLDGAEAEAQLKYSNASSQLEKMVEGAAMSSTSSASSTENNNEEDEDWLFEETREDKSTPLLPNYIAPTAELLPRYKNISEESIKKLGEIITAKYSKMDFRDKKASEWKSVSEESGLPVDHCFYIYNKYLDPKIKKMGNWTHNEDLDLLRYVVQFRFYKSTGWKYATWPVTFTSFFEIGEYLDRSGIECKERFHYLRKHYPKFVECFTPAKLDFTISPEVKEYRQIIQKGAYKAIQVQQYLEEKRREGGGRVRS